jgi:SET and MYND domain-containing protein 4
MMVPTGIETSKKDTNASIDYRTQGNLLYKQNKFFEALEFYNLSIMSAFPNSPERSLAYANRSAVYLEVKEYQFCLENIQFALDSGYSVEKLQTLKDREEKCKKLMESEVKSGEDDPNTFFKLSYPANEKIPFIADCLELRENEKYGRYIVTVRGKKLLQMFLCEKLKLCLILFIDLHPGDIIAIEKPYFFSFHPGKEHLRCNYCLRSKKMNLIPHDKLNDGETLILLHMNL